MKFASGFARGDKASPELAAAAVRQALERSGAELAGSVLLFLTPQFARAAQGAVTAAARAARCLQVAGCTAPGVLTETDWSLDEPAAAALVLSDGAGLAPPQAHDTALTLLSRAAGNRWQTDGRRRLGILSTDAEGGIGGRVWQGAKLATLGRCEAAFRGVRLASGTSRGLRLLSPPLPVSEADGHEVFEVAGRPALAGLRELLPDGVLPPLAQLFALLPDADLEAGTAITDGRFGLLPLMGISEDEQSVSLALPLAAGERLIWAMRQPATALADTSALLDALAREAPTPVFGLLFACIGRGPYFFGGEDRDRAAILDRFPGLPLAGAYGGAEIAPLAGGGSDLISYSAVMALASTVTNDVQS